MYVTFIFGLHVFDSSGTGSGGHRNGGLNILATAVTIFLGIGRIPIAMLHLIHGKQTRIKESVDYESRALSWVIQVFSFEHLSEPLLQVPHREAS